MVRKGWQLLAAIALAGLVPNLSFAYIRPADAVLSSVARRRAAIAFKTLIAEGIYRRGDDPPRTAWEAIQAGQSHRIERKDTNETEVVLTTNKKRWRFKLGETTAPTPVKKDLIMTFLGNPETDPGGARGLAFLEYHGIDHETMCLSRLDGRIAYVIGAGSGETDKPQLWIDKEFLLPIRLVTVDKKEGKTTDIQLSGYGSAATGEWYPRQIEVHVNGQLIETTTYKSARLNDELAPELFKPPK